MVQGNSMLDTSENNGGDIDANDSTNNNQEVVQVVEEEEEEGEDVRREQKDELDAEQPPDGDGDKENSHHGTIRNDHKDDNCGRGDSLAASAELQPRIENESRSVGAEEAAEPAVTNVPEDVVHEGDNKASGAALLAARSSPFPMPSPSAKPRTPGILRLDTSGKKSRRSSGISSVEFRNDPEMLGEVID